MNNLTKQLKDQKEKHLEVLDFANEILSYFGARNEGQRYSGDYILQVMDGIRAVQEYVRALLDDAEALELENGELKAR